MNWFWDNIHLKKEDRLGMYSFLCLLLVLLLAKWYMVALYHPSVKEEHSTNLDNIEFTSLESPINKHKPKVNSSISKPKKKNRAEERKNEFSKDNESMPMISLFEFDPNTVSYDSMLTLGISKYAAKNISKYRARGGQFRRKEDLRKIYGLDSTTYMEIQPYMQLKNRKENLIRKQKSPTTYKNSELALNAININLADTSEFKKLKGIGSVYAKRIVKFRNSLGGYFTINQIKDVWGISDSLFFTIKPYLAMDSADIEKKNINALDKNALVRHPYIDWRKAKAIVSYRKMHGNYKSIDDFEKLHAIEEDFIDTLKHYYTAK